MRAFALVFLTALVPASMAQGDAQTPAQQRYEILSISVEGTSDEASQTLVRSVSGLRSGTTVALPWDPQFAEAVRALYSRGGYSDVQIEATEIAGNGVFLTIKVVEEPRLAGFGIEGMKSSEVEDLQPLIPLLRGRAVRQADIERGELAIREYLRGNGHRQPEIIAQREAEEDGRVRITYLVDKGERLTVGDIRFEGNEAFSDGTLGRRFSNTLERRWWRFWKKETFDDQGFQEDLASLISYYNDRGYYGARVVRDSVYTVSDDDRDELVVEVEVAEGPQYHIRDIVFEGNTIYTDQQLQLALGMNPGDVYDRGRIQTNVNGYTADKSDITSLYRDQGYLTFRIDEEVIEAPGDSLDLYFEITEGDIYEFGEIRIAGNTRTKEHVIRRELRTVPGQRFSQDAIERTVRELATLNYFDPASFGAGPSVNVDDESKTVDLVYNLSEVSSDQLELSGGYGGGNIGLILTARVTFNNFSIQNLSQGFSGGMPTGDGQQLSLQVQTYGSQSQIYSLSFTEPWFRGRPTPIGFSLSYQNSDFSRFGSDAKYGLASARVFYQQRLKWPDDFFQTGTNLGYRLYNISNLSSSALPDGISQELTISQSLSRNALSNPTFPQSGSSVGLNLTVAPPIPGFLQYYKTDFNTAFYTPVAGRLVASVTTQFGYIGSLTGDDVAFQRYVVGGTPLEASGRSRIGRGFGQDLVYLRGYPIEAIGPRQDGVSVGGRILNKYEAELGILLLQTPQLSVQPYLFADAANTYDSFDDYDPSRLFRSAGFGARLFLPILGLVDLTAGYQIDSFSPLTDRPSDVEDAQPGWRFQFSLGGR